MPQLESSKTFATPAPEQDPLHKSKSKEKGNLWMNQIEEAKIDRAT